jgi:predicted TIM-barrel fold metal-dependent hydrolase
MKNSQLTFGMYDADVHYYETRDSFTRYMPRKLMPKAVHVRKDDAGREQWFVGDRHNTFWPFWSFEEAQRPGGLQDLLHSIKDTTVVTDEKRAFVPMQEDFLARPPRLALMEKWGVDAALVLPTIGFTVEHFMADDEEALYANLHSFNQWLDDEWGFDHEGRIYAAPLANLLNLDRAVEELEWLIGRGARTIHVRPGPGKPGMSLADRYYDPFWARANEAGVSVSLHSSESSYNSMYSTWWGEQSDPSPFTASMWQWTNTMIERPIMETLSSMIYHNFFERFPNVKVASIENGSSWVYYLLPLMDKGRAMGRNGPWPEGQLDDRPSRIFKEHILVAPYPEDDLAKLVDFLGAKAVMAGSDYPHPEGLANPSDFVDSVMSLSEPDKRLIMRNNMRRFVGLPAD